MTLREIITLDVINAKPTCGDSEAENHSLVLRRQTIQTQPEAGTMLADINAG
jgi:hypothetical protein